MDGFILPIFPQDSLASSVITTVWVGVLVSSFFNVRFGWVLSGLVVPGYLVPLFIVKPWSASVIVLEGVLTYLLVWFWSEYLSKRGDWDNFFGRDRFFAFFISSIVVRILFDGFLLPKFGAFINDTLHINFDYQTSLHSFGLIIVALLANQFWRPGLVRGIAPFLIVTGITYIIVRYGLVEFTNFTTSNLNYLYEDIAASMLESPKAYILLIIAALVALRMNLHYGWELNGVLIPALIALQWYQPMKILSSFVEAFIVLIIAELILNTPYFKGRTVEKSQKVLLFFNVSFAYKFLLAYFLFWFFPDQKITDYYGFGYLLATLMAIKMHDKDVAVRLTRGTVQVSFVALLVANSVGFGLTFLPNPFKADALQMKSEEKEVLVNKIDTPLVELYRKDKLQMYKNLCTDSAIMTFEETKQFDEALDRVLLYARNQEPRTLIEAAKVLQGLGFAVDLVQERYVHIYNTLESKGGGVYLIDTQNKGNFLLEVPVPLKEWGTMESGIFFFTLMHAKALGIAGSCFKEGVDEDVMESVRTPYHIFHEKMAHNNVLQLRGYSQSNIKGLEEILKETEGKLSVESSKSSLWVKSTIPQGFDIVMAKKLLGEMSVTWSRTPFSNNERDSTKTGFAELFISRHDMRQVLFSPNIESHASDFEEVNQVDGHLQSMLLKRKRMLAARGSDEYRVPRFQDLLFFDKEIFSPVLNLVENEYIKNEWTDVGKEELKVVSAAANMVGYKLVWFRHKFTGKNYLILFEDENRKERNYWGTFVFRLGEKSNFLLNVPRPLYEVNVLEYSIGLFERLNARALLINGAHPLANRDKTSDIVFLRNKQNLISLGHQVALRELGDIPFMTIQCRSMGVSEDFSQKSADIFVAFDNSITNNEDFNPLSRKLVETLEKDGLRVDFVDGSKETAGYETGMKVEGLYQEETKNKDFSIVWLSPEARAQYRNQRGYYPQIVQFVSLSEDFEEGSLLSLLEKSTLQETPEELYKEFTPLLERYLVSQDIVILDKIVRNKHGYRLKRFIDSNSMQAFLLVYTNDNKLTFIANLAPKKESLQYTLERDSALEKIVDRFIETRGKHLSIWRNFETR